MGGGLESRCVGRVYSADGAVRRHHDDGRMYPKTCRAKNTSIKLPSCIKLAFHIITSITSMWSVSFKFSPTKS